MSGRADDRDAAAAREELYALLGTLPKRDLPISAELLAREDRGDHVLETLRLHLNGIETVPAYFVKPSHARDPLPAILYNHSHGNAYHVGKRELLDGQSYLASPAWVASIVSRGWAGLAIDHWCFGERAGRTELDTFKAMLWQGYVLWGMMVFDSLRALDYLESRDDVDSSRLATVGMSMGSTMAWWLAALDTRVRVTVDICCLTDFETLLEEGRLDAHGIYYYVPGLLKRFSTARINALIAPRPHLAIAGTRDVLTPLTGLDRIEREVSAVYAGRGSPENFRLSRYDTGHVELREGREEALAFLEEHLEGG